MVKVTKGHRFQGSIPKHLILQRCEETKANMDQNRKIEKYDKKFFPKAQEKKSGQGFTLRQEVFCIYQTCPVIFVRKIQKKPFL